MGISIKCELLIYVFLAKHRMRLSLLAQFFKYTPCFCSLDLVGLDLEPTRDSMKCRKEHPLNSDKIIICFIHLLLSMWCDKACHLALSAAALSCTVSTSYLLAELITMFCEECQICY